MRTLIGLVVLGACGHGETPALGDIVIRASSCTVDGNRVELAASIEVGLEHDQAIRVAFLPELDGIRFSRTTTWDCSGWTVIGGNQGCGRDLVQPEIRQSITVIQQNTALAGTLPPAFTVTLVAAITEVVEATSDLENVIVTDRCD